MSCTVQMDLDFSGVAKMVSSIRTPLAALLMLIGQKTENRPRKELLISFDKEK